MSKKEFEIFCRHPVYICYLAAWNGKCYNHGNLCVYNLFSLLNFGLEIGTIKVSGWWIVDLIKVGEKCAFLMPDLHLVHTCCWSPDCTLLLGSSNPAKIIYSLFYWSSPVCVWGADSGQSFLLSGWPSSLSQEDPSILSCVSCSWIVGGAFALLFFARAELESSLGFFTVKGWSWTQYIYNIQYIRLLCLVR